MTTEVPENRRASGWLSAVERVGNLCPDPVFVFVLATAAVWLLSALLSPFDFGAKHPRDGAPLVVVNQLSSTALTNNLVKLVENFTSFPPLGLVLVAMLGVAVAERAGLIAAVVRGLLAITPHRLLTPMVLVVAVVSHSAADTGFVLVVPLGGVIFQAAGRNALAGVAVAFAGVSAGFSASFIPSSLDPLLQGFTEAAARIVDPAANVNPLCNWGFMSASSALLVAVGWYVAERYVIPRVEAEFPAANLQEVAGARFEPLARSEIRALTITAVVMTVLTGLLVWAAAPSGSPLRDAQGSLLGPTAPLMKSIVPLLFLFFLIAGVVYGAAAGTMRTHRDVVAGMTAGMETMAYYMVMAFFAAQFTAAIAGSNLGALLSVKGADFLTAMNAPPMLLLVAVILLATLIDLAIGSASAKWAFMAPILVPMLMRVGVAPEWTQAAFRIGDSTANVLTPLMPYFPLVLTYCQRYSPRVGVGSLIAMMLPFSLSFLAAWTALLCAFWTFRWPLGL